MTTDGAGISRGTLETSDDGELRYGVAFLRLAFAALVIRLMVAPWMAHSGDMGTFIAWGKRLAEIGPTRFWSGDYWCDYLPGYLLVLWMLGKVSAFLPGAWDVLLFKLPNLLADLVTAWMIWRLTRERAGSRHLWIPFAYLLSPAVLFNSTIWGQADSLHAALLVGALYLVVRRRVLLAGLVLGYAVAFKPHTLVILPFALLLAIRLKLPAWRVALAVMLVAVVFVATFLPFGGTESPVALGDYVRTRVDTTMGEYGYASVNALNFWYLVGQNWKPDSTEWLGVLTIRQVGTGICCLGIAALLAFAFVCTRIRTPRAKRGAGAHGLARRESADEAGPCSAPGLAPGVLMAAGLAYLVVFLFVTRAHERHVFPYFVLVAVAIAWRPAVIVPWLLLTATYCVNLYLSWRYCLPGNQSAVLCPPVFGNGLCLLNLAVLPLTLVACLPSVQRWFIAVTPLPESEGAGGGVRSQAVGSGSTPPGASGSASRPLLTPASAVALPAWHWPLRYRRLALIGIMLFAGATRFVRLNAPGERYFDEVYHAYTAEQWVKGNTDAWLWDKHAPEKGCSYEWTHPPLAKLMMAWSMRVFGVHPWAWRLPGAIFGTLTVWLIYLLARSLLRHDGVALLAACFASLDALPLFASRIGMNDVYFLAFMLLAVILALRDRWAVFAPLAIGLALACKWTALYALPLLGFIHLIRGMHQPSRLPLRLVELAAIYVIVVPTIYVASYLPFFQAGHTQAQFAELQKQMWWYHTGLKATHPYSSKAWQWPVLQKAVWCYTDRVEEDIRAATVRERTEAEGLSEEVAGIASDEATEARSHEGTKARSYDGTEVRSDEGTKALRHGGTEGKDRAPVPVRKRTVVGTANSGEDDAPDSTAAPERILEIVRPTPKDVFIANVYAWGNPIIWGAGLGALIFALYHVLRYRDEAVLIVLAGYLAFWAPWLASPRIMFLYHYLPSLPFLYIALAWSLARTGMTRFAITTFTVIALIAFALLIPYVTAIYMPINLTPMGWSK
ncbi:MAG: glycosyltransferase family 39 protein [Phycisphaerales bacterium]|nr:glycosyltransferase family 39 protein [Phycisphaerales bacterium]